MGLMRVDSDDVKCDQCGETPRLGQLYVCEQDDMTPQVPVLTEPVPTGMQATLYEMRQLGMSQSVIDQAKRGLYTPAQLEKLINQRKHVLEVIAEQTGAKYESQYTQPAPVTPQINMETTATNGTAEDTPATTRRYSTRLREFMDKRAKPATQNHPAVKCRAKLCPVGASEPQVLGINGEYRVQKSKADRHKKTCRPYLKERVFPTIDSVLAGGSTSTNLNQLLTTQGMSGMVSQRHLDPTLSVMQSFNKLSVSDVQVVRQIGLQKPKPVMSRFQTFATAFEEMPSSEVTTASSSSSYYEAVYKESREALPFGFTVCDDDDEEWDDIECDDESETDEMIQGANILRLHDLNDRMEATTVDNHARLNVAQPLDRRSSVPTIVPTPSDSVLRELKGKSPSSLPRLHIPPEINRKGSSVSLPLFQYQNENEHLQSIGPHLSRQSSKSSAPSEEVEVEGGLALTEESIEMGTPDIITQV